jgi:hypothetical protein
LLRIRASGCISFYVRGQEAYERRIWHLCPLKSAANGHRFRRKKRSTRCPREYDSRRLVLVARSLGG